MRYLTAGEIAHINHRLLGLETPLDFGLLESAAGLPQQSAFGVDAYPGMHLKAAALFRSLIRNHPFLDGNKRTAVTAVNVFYGLNGWELVMEDGPLVALALDVATGQFDIPTIAGVFKQWTFVLWTDEEPPPED